jgi:hypothetical protein
MLHQSPRTSIASMQKVVGLTMVRMKVCMAKQFGLLKHGDAPIRRTRHLTFGIRQMEHGDFLEEGKLEKQLPMVTQSICWGSKQLQDLNLKMSPSFVTP